ncbi:MAG: cupin domain-containing protein [Tropicimonas sp.]|uniref:cupin domain-containing protein n=1 Tax=Tropicimonas sp. TaxID=2067044 RepID=UPI003A8730FD
MLRSFPVIEASPGVTRQVLSEAPELMVVCFSFAEGSTAARHSHSHVQSSYIRSGRFRFSIGEESFEVGPGNSFVIPSGAEHGCICLEAGQVIDSFAPRRDDFL